MESSPEDLDPLVGCKGNALLGLDKAQRQTVLKEHGTSVGKLKSLKARAEVTAWYQPPPARWAALLCRRTREVFR